MKAVISKFNAKGTVKVPASKSICHRYLIMAYLSDFEETLDGMTYSDDIDATLSCLINMGANVERDGERITFKKPNRAVKDVTLNANESGSTLRFLIPLAMSSFDHVVFKGKKSLFSRPLGIYEEIFESQNIEYVRNKDSLETFGRLKLENFEVMGNVSSQFITGLLFFLLKDETNQFEIKVKEPFESKKYVEITMDVMREFGYQVKMESNVIRLLGHDECISHIHIPERDFSQAAFFLSLGAVSGSIRVKDMNMASTQGDKQIVDYLRKMKADIKTEGSDIISNKSELSPVEIDLKECIDLGPILFVVASLTNGTTHITNIRRLRIKESDRALSMKEELEKCGVSVVLKENDCYIKGKKEYSGDFVFDSHNDHRIAMALSVLSSRIDGKAVIENAECINKSYSRFFDDLSLVSGNVEIIQ